jgi:uncharacterized protein
MSCGVHIALLQPGRWAAVRKNLSAHLEAEMISNELLDILVCPACKTKVDLTKEVWLVCRNDQCRRKYPIRDDIPVMLIEEGDKSVNVSVEDLGKP